MRRSRDRTAMTWAVAVVLLIVVSCKRQQPDVVIVQIPIPAAAFAIADTTAEYKAQTTAKTNLAEKAKDNAT